MNKRCILVADDVKEIANSFARQVSSRYEVEVEVVYTSSDIITRHMDKSYDAIVLDNVFECDISGIEVIELIRQFDSKVRLILVTAFSDPEIRREVLRLGGSMLIKPVTIDKLFEKLEVKDENDII